MQAKAGVVGEACACGYLYAWLTCPDAPRAFRAHARTHARARTHTHTHTHARARSMLGRTPTFALCGCTPAVKKRRGSPGPWCSEHRLAAAWLVRRHVPVTISDLTFASIERLSTSLRSCEGPKCSACHAFTAARWGTPLAVVVCKEAAAAQPHSGRPGTAATPLLHPAACRVGTHHPPH